MSFLPASRLPSGPTVSPEPDDDDFDDGKGSRKGNVLLRNVVKVEDIDDPVAIGVLQFV